MPIIEKCGRSGVELHEIRRNVDAEGNDTTSKGKPKNGYTDGRIIVAKGTTGYNCNRPRSCGWGPSKPQINEKVPELNKALKRLLLDIDDGKVAMLPKNNKLALLLVTHDLIMWSESRQMYVAMAEGRRVADLFR